MSPREMSLWLAMWHLEPWGEYPASVSRAICGAAAVNVQLKSPISADKLMPQWGTDGHAGKMTKDDWLAFCAAHNMRQQQPIEE